MSRRSKKDCEEIKAAAAAPDFSNLLSKENIISFVDSDIIDSGDTPSSTAMMQHKYGKTDKKQLVKEAINKFQNEKEEREWAA